LSADTNLPQTPILDSVEDNAEHARRVAVVMAYHERTKHRIERYAAGPETLDWTAQPNPFRRFRGAGRVALPLTASQWCVRLREVYMPGAIDPAPLTLDALGAFLQLSLAISAWKEYGADRWALRCNPSSGNLHPTEGYVIGRGIANLEDGLYHYAGDDHILERRARWTGDLAAQAMPRLWIGLTSIHWREAWKYGERAFRYCQLDIGHALGALRYAAAVLGWTLRMVDCNGSETLRVLLGLDRDGDFLGAEPEEADVLLEVSPTRREATTWQAAPTLHGSVAPWWGQANVLDPRPMYRWPVIDEVAAASRYSARTRGISSPSGDGDTTVTAPLGGGSAEDAVQLILQRRSAQRFTANYHMPAQNFYRLLDTLLARPRVPWDMWPQNPCLHPILFVHRVEGLPAGLYVLPRGRAAATDLRAAMREDFAWHAVEGCPVHLPLSRLLAGDCRAAARTLSCHQAIAADSCFALSMLAQFAEPLQRDPWQYRAMHWEAGLLGHVLYLEAEAAGLRGTGIGCYFDDAVHEMLGLRDSQFQALYHFTVGQPQIDARISTLPAYPGRTAGAATGSAE
jgi:SagB-type dehydrogenase family enzyme